MFVKHDFFNDVVFFFSVFITLYNHIYIYIDMKYTTALHRRGLSSLFSLVDLRRSTVRGRTENLFILHTLLGLMTWKSLKKGIL